MTNKKDINNKPMFRAYGQEKKIYRTPPAQSVANEITKRKIEELMEERALNKEMDL